MKVAIYPGSFDPITNGHLNILKRALSIFDKVIVLIAINPEKESRFSLEDRISMIKDATKDMDNIEIDYTSGLTVQYAKEHNAKHLIRGLRAVSDFEYEFALCANNNFIDDSIDMVFLMSHEDTSFISSSAIDSFYKSGVDITPLVPSSVIKMYQKRK